MVYIFSGLGADERVFEKLHLGGCRVKHVKWLKPLKNEDLRDYATRVREVEGFEEDAVLLGLSFGGIMALEVAKLGVGGKLILISSAKSKNEIPFYFRVAGALKMHRLIPVSFLLNPGRLTYWFFGVDSEEDKLLLRSILRDTDIDFLRWAIERIVNWNNQVVPAGVFHIHGKADRLLPACFITNSHLLTGAGHLMVLNKAQELSALLKSVI